MGLLLICNFIIGCHGHLEHTISLSYADLQNTCNLIRKLKYLYFYSINCFMYKATDAGFPRFCFHLNFIIVNKHCQLLSLM